MIDSIRIIGILIAIGISVSSILYARTLRNSRRIITLQVEFAKMSNVSELMSAHEDRQDKLIDNFERKFESLDKKLDEVRLNVAAIMKTTNGKRI